jgi:FKBP-type peptidyl-prolyl cis-trans isomerase SlyD
MEISQNKVVSVSYILKANSIEGEVIETTENSHPLEFIFGIGRMLPKFEEYLSGKKTGDLFNFSIACEEGYGPYRDDDIVDLPIKTFEIDGELRQDLIQIDNMVPLQDNQGNVFKGKVVAVSETLVTLDFNHPLAKTNLYFSGEVVNVREATDEEPTHGHIHHECHGCGKH